MSHWFTYSLFALLFFGLWGLFSKLTITHIDAKNALIFQTIGIVIVSIFLLKNFEFRTFFNIKGLGFGILTGAAYGIGCLFYLIAADKGKLITVVTLTALYPIITILLSLILLQESITLKECAGVLLALTAIVLMSV